MNPARAPRERRSDARLLAVDSRTGRHADLQAADLPSLLRPGDLLVVNDAATLPASLRGVVAGGGGEGSAVELRLAGMAAPQAAERFSPLESAESARNVESGEAPVDHFGDATKAREERAVGGGSSGLADGGGRAEPPLDDTFWAVLFGAGDWRTPTENRPTPPLLAVGDRVALVGALAATVIAVSPISPRLLRIRFTLRGAALWQALYAHGRPVQYAYLHDQLALWSVQTAYGARPWAAEMPSAGRPLSWEILNQLRRTGVELAWLTHAAGLSSTGEPALDAALPLPERYEIPDTTAQLIARTRRRGGRVIAVGTTVVRALEGAAQAAEAAGVAATTPLMPSGVTDLVLTPTSRLRIVDGILTGIHSPDESHFNLLAAFCPLDLLRQSWEHAARTGYLCHEFGDLSLILPDLAELQGARRAGGAS